MKKIAFILIFMLLLQGAAFAEGDADISIATEAETAVLAAPETETAVETETEAETETEPEPAPEPAPVPVNIVNAANTVNLYVFGNKISLSSYPVLIGNTLMLPIREYLLHLGAGDYTADGENSITITYGDKIASFTVGSKNAVLNYYDVELPEAPFYLDGIVYAPVGTICQSLGFSYIEVSERGKIKSYSGIPTDTVEAQKAEARINGLNLSSETPYLIWVNKSSYTVHAFLGGKNNWKEIYCCRCAIGASGSPTVTGTFKYFSRESRWSYENFYVGPIMRFYGSYAIHSTLLKYDGSDYNNAVGVRNSHGCVRVRPGDIAWLIYYIPLKTTVYVTER